MALVDNVRTGIDDGEVDYYRPVLANPGRFDLVVSLGKPWHASRRPTLLIVAAAYRRRQIGRWWDIIKIYDM